MSGIREKHWKKWKASETTSSLAVAEKKTTDSINSQRSSSLIRSRKRHKTRDLADNIILAAESKEIIIPSKSKSTSPFNTLSPTNPFYRDNVIILQYGEVKDNKTHRTSDTRKSIELWDELPSTEIVESPKPGREKGPKGESQYPTADSKSENKPSAPPASPMNEKAHHRSPPQAHPQTTSGPSASYGPPPRSGQTQNTRTSPPFDQGNGTCDYPECPARGTKQKERLCMAPECPVTMKKAVIKEAKKAMKRSCGKKRKNPLTILREVLMSTFAGHDSSCKLTKEEKKALKRMKQVEEDVDGNSDRTTKTKRSKGVQCKAPMSQKNDRTNRGPEKANKSTACDVPECPIAAQKTKIKEFMDKGQLCDIPNCPVKEPPPRKEKKVEPPKGCPLKPCTLKTKDEEFLKQLDPCIFEKIPRLKMTCDQALADENREQSQSHHAPPAIKNTNNPTSNRTKEKDRAVSIVAAHVRVPQSSENPFLNTLSDLREFPDSNKLTGIELGESEMNKASECKKIMDRRLSVSVFVPEVESEKFQRRKSGQIILQEKETSVIGTEDETSNKKLPDIEFSDDSVNQNDSLRLQIAPEINDTIESTTLNFSPKKPRRSIKSVKMKFGESLNSEIDGVSNEKSIDSISTTENEIKMKPIDIFPDENVKKVDSKKILEDFSAPKSYTLMTKSDIRNDQKSGSLKFDFSPALEDFSLSNKSLEVPFDLPIQKGTSAIKLLRENLNSPKNSAAFLTESKAPDPSQKSNPENKCDDCLSKIISRTKNEEECSIENFSGIAPSIEINSKKAIISLHLCQDTRSNRKLLNYISFDKKSSEFFGKDEKVENIFSLEHNAFAVSFSSPRTANQIKESTSRNRKSNDSKGFNETYTQTLATSAVSPNELNTIGVGQSSTIYFDFRTFDPKS